MTHPHDVVIIPRPYGTHNHEIRETVNGLKVSRLLCNAMYGTYYFHLLAREETVVVFWVGTVGYAYGKVHP